MPSKEDNSKNILTMMVANLGNQLKKGELMMMILTMKKNKLMTKPIRLPMVLETSCAMVRLTPSQEAYFHESAEILLGLGLGLLKGQKEGHESQVEEAQN